MRVPRKPPSLHEFNKEARRLKLKSGKIRWPLKVWEIHHIVCDHLKIPPLENYREFYSDHRVFESWWPEVKHSLRMLPDCFFRKLAPNSRQRLDAEHFAENRWRNPNARKKLPRRKLDKPISAKLWAIKSPNAFTKDEREAFFKSQQWKEARYQVFLRDGKVCACCGVNGPGIVFHIDHIRPLWTNPELALDLTNLQVMCSFCNEGKGALDSTDWRKNAKPQASMEEP